MVGKLTVELSYYEARALIRSANLLALAFREAELIRAEDVPALESAVMRLEVAMVAEGAEL